MLNNDGLASASGSKLKPVSPHFPQVDAIQRRSRALLGKVQAQPGQCLPFSHFASTAVTEEETQLP